MSPRKSPAARRSEPRAAPRLRGIVSQRSLDLPDAVPELQARSVSEHPFLYRKMLPRAEGVAQRYPAFDIAKWQADFPFKK